MALDMTSQRDRRLDPEDGRAVETRMTSPAPPDFYDDLDLTLAEAWRLLVVGAADRRSAFHTPTVATNGGDGAPAIRTIVLRAADQATRTLRFHTDRRSAKFADISRDARVALHAYEAPAKVQLRVAGRARLHGFGDPVAKMAWTGSQRQSRLCYGQHAEPGQVLDDPVAALAGTDDPDGGEVHFTAVVITVARLEWLYLASAGHRRARYEWTGENWRGHWLAP